MILILALVTGLALTAGPAGGAGGIRVRLTGLNHHPVVGHRWTYWIVVTNSRGQRLSGTETTHYLYNGAVVGTERPVNVRFRNGYYHDTLIFPKAALGHPLRVWTVIKTRQGSGSAAWWIVVVRR